MDNSILWTSLFDPRYASALHLSDTEKGFAITRLKREIQSLIVPFTTLPPQLNEDENRTNMDVELLSEEDDDDAMFEVPFERIHTPTPTVRSSTNTSTDSPGSKLKKIRVEEEAKINEEVDTYLYHLSKVDVQSIKCPLKWWKENRFKYPKVAIGARKWLSVCATSMPSERVFSISSLIHTPKHSTLTGKSIYDQVLIHNNWECLNPSLDRLRQYM